MAKQSTSTRPTTPAQPNVALRAHADMPKTGGLRWVDPNMPFDRITEITDDGVHCTFTTRIDENPGSPAYVFDVTFVMPKAPRVVALWAARALVIDVQSRFRRAFAGKRSTPETRQRALTAATWSRVTVDDPTTRVAGDPAKRAAADAAAMRRTIAALRARGDNKTADALAAALTA